MISSASIREPSSVWTVTGPPGTRGDLTPAEPGPGRTRDVLDALREHGALFRPDLTTVSGRLSAEVEEALWRAWRAGWSPPTGSAPCGPC